jgi:hypothetical protein
MTAALGTLPFIATLWLLVVLGAAVLEESGAKIAAALKGKPERAPSYESKVRHRRPHGCATRRVSVEWRAAA